MRVYCELGRNRKGERQHQQVIAVDLQRTFPQPEVSSRLVAKQFANIDAAHQQRREKDKTLCRRHKTYGLIHKIAEARREMRERHPDQKKPPQGVEFRTAFKLGKMHSGARPLSQSPSIRRPAMARVARHSKFRTLQYAGMPVTLCPMISVWI